MILPINSSCIGFKRRLPVIPFRRRHVAEVVVVHNHPPPACHAIRLTTRTTIDNDDELEKKHQQQHCQSKMVNMTLGCVRVVLKLEEFGTSVSRETQSLRARNQKGRYGLPPSRGEWSHVCRAFGVQTLTHPQGATSALPVLTQTSKPPTAFIAAMEIWSRA